MSPGHPVIVVVVAYQDGSWWLRQCKDSKPLGRYDVIESEPGSSNGGSVFAGAGGQTCLDGDPSAVGILDGQNWVL